MPTIQYIQASGSDDTTAIQAAVTSLQASGSETKTLVLSGNITLSSAITVSADPGVMFEGINCTVTQEAASTPAIQLSNLTSGGCRGITFVADAEDDDAVEVTDCTDVVIENCDFTNYTRYGAVFSGTCTGSRFDSLKEDAEFAVELLKDLTAETRTTYNHTVYSYSAAAQAVGADPYELLTSYWWYDYVDGAYVHDRVDPATVAAGILYSRSEGETGPALINIEYWDPIDNTHEQFLRHLELACSSWRMGTGRDIGMYRLLPYSDYGTPVHLKRAIDGNTDYSEAAQTALVARNMKINNWTEKRLGKYIDFVCPRCYVSYGTTVGIAEWKWYATLSVMEALRCSRGKPVYPIVWFNAHATSEELTEAHWIESLQWVAALPGISGIMVYSGGDVPSGYTWTDAIDALVDGTGDFADS